ncbi:fibrillarin, partial [Candidatus Woesearchaeota archaeon CG_4_10_14_0_2_um_filter_57_5]
MKGDRMGAEKVDNPLLIVEKKATFTKALVKGPVYGEKTFTRKDGQWREWVPKRSKLCAAIRKGMRQFPFDNDSTVLYLGAASGTT